MVSRVVLFSHAKEDLAQLPQKAREQIAHAVDDLGEFPGRRIGIKKLKAPFTGFRKRVGNCRILFDYVDTTVFIHRIKNRKDAYK